VITEPLDYYHYGKETNTAPDLNGLDVRGEVMLLTRNVVVSGEDVESWGA